MWRKSSKSAAKWSEVKCSDVFLFLNYFSYRLLGLVSKFWDLFLHSKLIRVLYICIFLIYDKSFRTFRKQNFLCLTAAFMPILIWNTIKGRILQKLFQPVASWILCTDDLSHSNITLYWRRYLTYNCTSCYKHIPMESKKSLRGAIALQWKEFGGTDLLMCSTPLC